VGGEVGRCLKVNYVVNSDVIFSMRSSPGFLCELYNSLDSFLIALKGLFDLSWSFAVLDLTCFLLFQRLHSAQALFVFGVAMALSLDCVELVGSFVTTSMMGTLRLRVVLIVPLLASSQQSHCLSHRPQLVLVVLSCIASSSGSGSLFSLALHQKCCHSQEDNCGNHL
jgi:hypothetical protein